ncbi:hypothetical protein V6N13_082944 [Hibiscus sabdariffa]
MGAAAEDLATCRTRGGEVPQVQLDLAPCRWRGPQQLHPSAPHAADFVGPTDQVQMARSSTAAPIGSTRS